MALQLSGKRSPARSDLPNRQTEQDESRIASWYAAWNMVHRLADERLATGKQALALDEDPG